MFSDSMMLGGGRKAAFSIANSVCLDGVADYFTRTPTVTGNRKTWTFSCWVKRSKLGTQQQILSAGVNTNDYEAIGFDTDDKLTWTLAVGNVWQGRIVTSAVFRDSTSWGHLVVTKIPATGTLNIFWNGVLQPISVVTAVADIDGFLNGTTEHRLGFISPAISLGYFNGYVTNPILVDGTALDPSSFGETDPVTGSWRPKRISGLDFGTNGFYLGFNNPADLGKDVSGNGNHWLPASLGTADVVTDTPTNNFVTLNPLDNNAVTLSNGNRYGAGNSSAWRAVRGTFPIPATGKWGFKIEKVANTAGSGSGQSNCWFGLVKTTPLVTALSAPSTGDTDWLALGDHGWSSNFAVQTDQSAPLNSADTAELLVDRDAGTFIFKKNGTQIQAGTLGFNGPLVPGYVVFSSAITMVFDFGQAGYTPSDPTYKALCTANLPKPAIQAPAKHMDVVTYTGTGAPQTITGLGFAPDLVWIKARSNPTTSWLHRLTSRGLAQPNYLSPNATDAEKSILGNITSLDANGFTTNGNGGVGESGVSHVAWCWKAGGELVANSDGTVASTVSANPAAGFSIVSYTSPSNAADQTVGHGLNAPPALIIVKNRDADFNWDIYHKALGHNANLIFTADTPRSSTFNSTINSAVFGTISWYTHYLANRYIAYCWSEIPGFSKFASYSGNGSSDGPFVHCGFRPRFVLIKRTDAAGNWSIVDTERSPANDGTWESLQANSTQAESNIAVDGLSTGFKIRDTGGDINASGGTYIFAAFAEAPLGGAKMVPAKAR